MRRDAIKELERRYIRCCISIGFALLIIIAKLPVFVHLVGWIILLTALYKLREIIIILFREAEKT